MSIVDREQWFASPLGQYLLAQEQAHFDRQVSDIFGFNACQFGMPEFDLLRASRIPYRFTLAPDEAAQVRADFHYLPLENQSIDLALLPHVLEFSPHAHQILREVERVLLPEGQVLISSFNPMSLLGVRRLFGERRSYPWYGDFISLMRIKDWLALLGFEIVGGRMCCYAPPFAREKWLRYFRFMEAAGDRWWALGGGVFMLQARKRVHGTRIITPNWKNGLPEPAISPATQKPAVRKSEYELVE